MSKYGGGAAVGQGCAVVRCRTARPGRGTDGGGDVPAGAGCWSKGVGDESAGGPPSHTFQVPGGTAESHEEAGLRAGRYVGELGDVPVLHEASGRPSTSPPGQPFPPRATRTAKGALPRWPARTPPAPGRTARWWPRRTGD
ncbi:hypothetical protein LV779_02565 [Streptomyces thinghirensis]|nr:hypothetical protein [Streptomyces thinghirensis]